MLAQYGGSVVDAGRPESSSSWTINWFGVLPLLLIAAIAIVAWRWIEDTAVFGQDDDPPSELDMSAAPEPTDTGDEVARATVPRPSTTTRPAGPTTPPSTTTEVATDPRVLISGELKPCRYGSECLVASFTIEGFQEHPGRFVCIYPNSRSDFGFGDTDVDDACLTADDGDTITIEVDGVRSATISELDLDGAAQPD